MQLTRRIRPLGRNHSKNNNEHHIDDRNPPNGLTEILPGIELTGDKPITAPEQTRQDGRQPGEVISSYGKRKEGAGGGFVD